MRKQCRISKIAKVRKKQSKIRIIKIENNNPPRIKRIRGSEIECEFNLDKNRKDQKKKKKRLSREKQDAVDLVCVIMGN